MFGRIKPLVFGIGLVALLLAPAQSFARTLDEIHERDKRDSQRASSPLVRASDAVVVDSTAMEPEEVARLVVLLAKEQAAASAN